MKSGGSCEPLERPRRSCLGAPPRGLGFYANQYPQSATREPHADFLPDLAEEEIPTLVIKGRCDYLSWSSAVVYLSALPDAQLLCLDGSGHNAYQDEQKRSPPTMRRCYSVKQSK